MFRTLVGVAVFAGLFLSTAQAQLVNNAFTYQGFVNDGPNAANGVYDMEFTVWDSATTGVVRGGQALEDVQITNGVFSVELNMGPIFFGSALWMQIGIRPGPSVDPYTILAPRQYLSAVPYAQGLVPGTIVFRDDDLPAFVAANGLPTLPFFQKSAIDAFTSNGIAIRAATGEGIGIWALHLAESSNLPAIRAESASTSALSSALTALLTADTPGFFSTAIYASTKGPSIGIWGFNETTGIGLFGSTTNSGTGVLGISGGSDNTSIGVFGSTSSPAGLGGQFTNSGGTNGSIGLRAHGGTNNAPDIVLGGESNSDDEGIIASDPRYAGSDLWLRSNDAVVVQLDHDASGEDSDFEIRDKDNFVIFEVDESGEMRMRAPGGPTTFRFLPTEGVGDGGQITLYQADGTASIELDAELGAGGPGRIITQELQITGGSDLSEHFTIRPNAAGTQPQPGMVVCIDPVNTGELAVSSQPYDRTVAGIISGAGGVRTGLMMGQRGTPEADGAHAVALTGRVYVWADATTGPIIPGDLLTTSAVPGHAMKVTDHARAQGAIIGKSMSRLDEGRGLVLVLVTLH